jgi:hypothetical protein
MQRIDVDPTARDQPRDQRIRVPHLAGSKLVAPPDRRWRTGHEVENAPRENRIVCQPLWAVDGLVDVGDQTSPPAPILVAEDPQGSSPAAADGAFRDDAPQFAFPSGIGAISIANVPSGTLTMRAE